MYVLVEHDAWIYKRSTGSPIYSGDLVDELELYFSYPEHKIKTFVYNWIWANTTHFNISKFWYRKSPKFYASGAYGVYLEPNYRLTNLIADV